MSIQSEAAKAHIEKLLREEYVMSLPLTFGENPNRWEAEYRFAPPRLWRFDYAVPSILCAIELDGGTFQGIRTGHASGVGLRNWREKNNEAMRRGWNVFHYAPEEVIKAGRKTLPDEPILRRLPWL